MREMADFLVLSLSASCSCVIPAFSRAIRSMTPILNCSYPVSKPRAKVREVLFLFATYVSKSSMVLSPSQVICFSFFRKPDLGLRCFLRLLLERVCQHKHLSSGKETEQSKRVVANINPD